jgi:hypothetical protein
MFYELTKQVVLKLSELGLRRQLFAGLRKRQASYRIDCVVNKVTVVIRYSNAVHNQIHMYNCVIKHFRVFLMLAF